MMGKAFGMRVNVYHYLLMLMLTLVSVTAMQSVGTILVVALLITPAATAYLFTKRLKYMIILAATLGGLSSLIGLFIGYSFNIAAGSAFSCHQKKSNKQKRNKKFMPYWPQEYSLS